MRGCVREGCLLKVQSLFCHHRACPLCCAGWKFPHHQSTVPGPLRTSPKAHCKPLGLQEHPERGLGSRRRCAGADVPANMAATSPDAALAEQSGPATPRATLASGRATLANGPARPRATLASGPATLGNGLARPRATWVITLATLQRKPVTGPATQQAPWAIFSNNVIYVNR